MKPRNLTPAPKSAPAPAPKPPLPSWAFPTPERPSYTDALKFPENLPALPSQTLGLFHGRYVGLHAYASSELAKITVEILRLESAIGRLRHQRYLMAGNTKATKYALDNVVESSPDVMDLRDRLLEWSVKKEYTLSAMLNFQRYAEALSREVSRRGQEQRLSH